jgi:type II secretory pathway component PulF
MPDWSWIMLGVALAGGVIYVLCLPAIWMQRRMDRAWLKQMEPIWRYRRVWRDLRSNGEP